MLNDGARTRVLTHADFLEALGRHRKASVRSTTGGEEHPPPVLQGEALKPFISKELLEKSRPVTFRTQHGQVASGYRADILPDVCAVYLQARTANALLPRPYHIATQAGTGRDRTGRSDPPRNMCYTNEPFRQHTLPPAAR